MLIIFAVGEGPIGGTLSPQQTAITAVGVTECVCGKHQITVNLTADVSGKKGINHTYIRPQCPLSDAFTRRECGLNQNEETFITREQFSLLLILMWITWLFLVLSLSSNTKVKENISISIVSNPSRLIGVNSQQGEKENQTAWLLLEFAHLKRGIANKHVYF